MTEFIHWMFNGLGTSLLTLLVITLVGYKYRKMLSFEHSSRHSDDSVQVEEEIESEAPSTTEDKENGSSNVSVKDEVITVEAPVNTEINGYRYINGKEKRFAATKTLYNLAQKEYELELDRSKSLDVKANVLLLLCSPPLLFVLNNSTPWKAFLNIFSLDRDTTNYEYSFSLIIVILTIIFVGLILASIIKIVDVIYSKSYEHLAIDEMRESLFDYGDEKEFSLFASVKYDLAVKENRKINNEKAKVFGSACSFLIYAYFMFVFYYLLITLSGLN